MPEYKKLPGMIGPSHGALATCLVQSQGLCARWAGRARVTCLVFMIATWPAEGAEPSVIGESELKAAFLPKFALFVEWPPHAFRTPSDALIIGIAGDAAFFPHLENAVAGKTVTGRPLVVQMCGDAEAARHCHIIFISGSDPKITAGILSALSGSSVLTISDAPEFASQGGMVNLVTANKRVRLEVNLEAIRRGDLRMDPQLLQMAKSVKTSPGNIKM